MKMVGITSRKFAEMWVTAKRVASTLHPVECDCDECKELCRRAPCMGTPEEMEALCIAGHSDKLALTQNVAFAPFGLPPIPMIAPRMTDKGCAFLDGCGHCTLHDKGLKPLEGRLASCKRTAEEGGAITMSLMQSWL